jgi:hypothetical protein
MHPLDRPLLAWLCLCVCLISATGCETHSGDYEVYDPNNNIIREPCFCCSTDTCSSPDGTEIQKFYYLKILDISTNAEFSNPGADIDAVRLTKVSGANHFAAKVIDYKPKAGVDISAESSLPENILGEPTAFAAEGQDFNTAGPASKCSLADEHYLGLGGNGGYVVVDFGNNDIANGDAITVYEIGNCTGNAGSPGSSDAITVQISVGKTIDESWQTVLSFTSGPVMSAVVSGLPQIPVQ